MAIRDSSGGDWRASGFLGMAGAVVAAILHNFGTLLALANAGRLERFSFSWKRRAALTFCFYAIPDGKTLRTFPGIALMRYDEPLAAQGEA
jgi:hypothetical protein